MQLAAGTRLGPYEIVSPIGAGGMGEVYRGRDTRLNRDVAIKVLPALFAGDPERLARFHREAQVLAALNHPNIAQIHGLEEHDASGMRVGALVMELVEGDDLSERLKRGPMSLGDALQVARQIAEALEAAHERGIVHRDLKPANVKLRRDGTVKVLDFGLAKPIEVTGGPMASGTSATTADGTALGVVVGTPAYMAPEQAVGAAVDRRADVWAFGVVLFEMLCGQRAFGGDATSQIIGNVLSRDPDWEALPAPTPAAVRRLLRRCITRDPRQRLQAIGDARIEIAEIIGSGPDPDAGKRTPPMRRRLPLAATAIGGVLLVAGGAFLGWRAAPRPAAGLTRYSIIAPVGDVVAAGRVGSTLAISPDGRTVVYAAARGGVAQLFRRSIDQLTPVPLNGTIDGKNPFFSPDGAWVVFDAGGKLRKVRLDGGADPIVICDATIASAGSWARDDTILFGGGAAGIQRVPASGGTPEAITRLGAGDFAHALPQLLPGERHALFHIDRGNNDALAAVALSDGTVTEIIAGTAARYSPTGHMVVTRPNGLWAVPFDAATLKIKGEETLLSDRPQLDIAGGVAHYAVTADGTLIYIPTVPPPIRQAVWIARGGDGDVLPIDPRSYSELAFSPTRDQVALATVGPEGMGVWVRDLTTRISIPIATGRAEAGAGAVWSRDGRRLAFSRWQVNRFNLFVRDADGTAEAVRVTDRPMATLAQFWTDNDEIVVVEVGLDGSSGSADLKSVSVSDGKIRDVLRTPHAELNAVLSPNGRYMAYQSNESGGWIVYVRPFPNVESARWVVSPDHGEYPRWTPDGRSLLYQSSGTLVRVAVNTNGAFTAGPPQPVFDAGFPTTGQTILEYITINRRYDVARDGRIAVLQDDPAAAVARAPREIVVVNNWLAQLSRPR